VIYLCKNVVLTRIGIGKSFFGYTYRNSFALSFDRMVPLTLNKMRYGRLI